MSSFADELLRSAVAHHQQGRLDQAQIIYQQILQANQDDPNALNLLGVVHHQKGRQAEAELLIRRAIALAPSVSGFHANLGNALLAQRRAPEAETAYRRAADLEPNYAEAWNNLGVALMAQGKVRESMPIFARAIELRLNYPSARNNLGNALRARRMYREAEKCYRDALAQDGAMIEAHSNLAITLLAMNRAEEAIETCRRALSLRPDHSAAQFTLGCALESVDRLDEAVTIYQEALRRFPRDDNLRFHLAALTGNATFDAAPPRYVASLFDNYADVFDRHLVEALQYRGPEQIIRAIEAAGAGKGLDVVDLGCRTGLCGALLRPMAKSLAGVDLSSGMIDRARERNVYDELFLDELVGFLRVRFGKFDLAVAADVFIYFGDLQSPLSAACQALRPGGLIVFTLEKHAGDRFILNTTRRYAHSPNYVRESLKAAGLAEVGITHEVLRTQSRQDVEGLVVVAKRIG